MVMLWTLPAAYGYVLIVGSLLGLELILIGFLIAGKTRYRIFTKKWMEINFLEEHNKATGEKDIAKGGAPDGGAGRYSDKLSYLEWFDFNNAQRAHIHFLEFAPSSFMWLFIAGIYFPLSAAGLGLIFGVFKLCFALGYKKSGPKGRIVGAVGSELCLIGLLGLSIASGYRFLQGQTA